MSKVLALTLAMLVASQLAAGAIVRDERRGVTVMDAPVPRARGSRKGTLLVSGMRLDL